ncbi:MAG: ergothioneine biosynthesis protein EgtB [Chloroflexi bacterium]|nr:ergothioneine biosynthesis protein EgtB [Chloroflexota bacterium]
MKELPKLPFQGVPTDPATLFADYQQARKVTEAICAPLEIEDYMVQAMTDASPARWHLGHVTWFFETFILKEYTPGYKPVNDVYAYLFNSYYNSAGPQFYRPHRGLISRPTVKQVYDYRKQIDEHMADLIETAPPHLMEGLVGSLIILGVNHEQQHQELLVTDIKYNLSVNPLHPVYQKVNIPSLPPAAPLRWVHFEGGLHTIGHDAQGFAFDNEWPRHQAYVAPFLLASRPVTNAEFMEFIEAGGYERVDLWLSAGWRTMKEQGWQAPLYWEKHDGLWWHHTMSGFLPVDQNALLCHVSYYEADAYARWRDKRLPTEEEWEFAALRQPLQGNLLESGLYHPLGGTSPRAGQELEHMFGDVWEWTKSAYLPYPGFQPLQGSVGEYNGKFMVNQMVLRGGSCATPLSHIRPTYRNFFPPDARWQFSGVRLADDA